MCITRVGKVVASSRGRASVEFFDGKTAESVDVSMVNAGRGEFVEVFGNLALSTLSPREAKERRKAWEEVRAALQKAGR